MARARQVQRRDPRGSQISTVVGTGGDFARSVGRSAAGISASLNALEGRRDQKARVAEAEQKAANVRQSQSQGRQDGFNPDLGPLVLQDVNTPEGRAYNQAATRSYLARLEIQGRQGLDKIAADYSHDPLQLQEKITSFAEGYGSGVPEQIKGEFDLMLSRLAAPFQREAGRLHRRAVSDADKAVFLEQLTQRSGDISRKAYLSEGSPEDDASLAGDIDGMRALLIEHGPKTEFELDGVTYPPDASRSGVMSAEAIVDSLFDMSRDVTENRVMGQFSRLDTAQAQAEFMENFQSEYRQDGSDIAKFSPDEYESIVTGMRQTLAQHERARKVSATEAKGVLRDMRQVVSAGFAPNPDELRDLGIMARSSGDPDLREDYRQLQADIKFTKSLQASNPQAVREVLAQAKSNPQGVRAEDVGRLKAAGAFLSTMETALAKDPLEWAQRQGVAAITPLDFEAELGPQIMARRGMAQTSAEYYGTRPRYFTNEEHGELKRLADQGGDAALSVAASVKDLDDASAFEVLSEVADDAPVLANMGALIKKGGDATLITQAAEGLALRASDGFQSRLPMKADLEQIIADSFGDAFAALPQAYEAVRETALLAYEAEAFQNGVAPGGGEDAQKILSRNLQKALGATYGRDPLLGSQERFGGVAEVRGQNVIAPPFLRHNKLEDVVDRLTPDLWEKAGGAPPVDIDGDVLTPEDLRGAYLVSSGDGQYRVALTDPFAQGAQYVGRANDGAEDLFILNLSAIEDDLRADPVISKWMLGGQ